ATSPRFLAASRPARPRSRSRPGCPSLARPCPGWYCPGCPPPAPVPPLPTHRPPRVRKRARNDPGPDQRPRAGSFLHPGPGHEPPARAALDEEPLPSVAADELLPFSAGAGEPPADDRADGQLLPPAAGAAQPPASGGLEDEPLLSGVEELRAGWQRARMAF